MFPRCCAYAASVSATCFCFSPPLPQSPMARKFTSPAAPWTGTVVGDGAGALAHAWSEDSNSSTNHADTLRINIPRNPLLPGGEIIVEFLGCATAGPERNAPHR